MRSLSQNSSVRQVRSRNCNSNGPSHNPPASSENGTGARCWRLVTAVSSSDPLFISVDFDPYFLSLDDFPGDPNRGRELPPAHIRWTCHSESQYSFDLFSNPILLLPPVPDMSMPFNVISLSCSLYAYLIGSLLTLLVRRASDRVRFKLHPEKKPQSKVRKLGNKLRAFLKGGQTGRNEKDEEVSPPSTSNTPERTGMQGEKEE